MSFVWPSGNYVSTPAYFPTPKLWLHVANSLNRAEIKTYATDPIREATIDALKRVVDSLLELMFETGITVQQFNYVVRDRAVRVASSRVLEGNRPKQQIPRSHHHGAATVRSHQDHQRSRCLPRVRSSDSQLPGVFSQHGLRLLVI